jgi:hypothetical protein
MPDITVTPSKRQDLLEVLSAYKHVQASETLHTLTFVTVNDYLWLLRAVSQELSVLGRSGMYYLAAAVSDFFLPRRKLVSGLAFLLVHEKYISTAAVSVRAQDSIGQGQPAHRDGSGPQNSETDGR